MQPRRRYRPPTPEDKAISLNRERLNACLDALGNKAPNREQLRALVSLADKAFKPGTAAHRMLSLLWTFTRQP